MKITLSQLKECASLKDLGDDFIDVVDSDGTAWLLVKQAQKVETDGIDPLIRDIAEYAVNEQMISASGIQRRFSIGYARASRIVDYMESKGYVTPAIGIKPRKVLLTKEQIEDEHFFD